MVETTWSSLQPIFQLSVTLNFGVTLIMQLSDSSVKGEKDFVESISRSIATVEESSGNVKYIQKTMHEIGIFNRIIVDSNAGLRLIRSRYLIYILYIISIASLFILFYSSTNPTTVVTWAFFVGISFCLVPSAVGLVFMTSERSLLKRLVRQREIVLENFGKIAT